jgi:hypothetical protein
MSEAKTRKVLLHVEAGEGLDKKSFAKKMARLVIDEINRERAAEGKPPLEKG